jgi:hypothetical protein
MISLGANIESLISYFAYLSKSVNR